MNRKELDKMDDNTAKNIAKDIFKQIENAQSVDSLVKVLKDKRISKNTMNSDKLPKKYPPIKFDIKYEEIAEYLMDGNLLEDNSEIKDPVAKLLYALVWKQGDLLKLKHIVKGIKGLDSEKFEGLVFNQFGKFLRNKGAEPIVDQHVIRAFVVFNSEKYKIDVNKLRKIELLNKEVHNDYIKDYKKWLSGLNGNFKTEENYIYHVDQILFALGKTIKIGKVTDQSHLSN